ncbi:unnamed protein product [Prorocentrum cordatum]|uniref:DUF4126 domain-containing protein n=1 Tax=Prorocentrum cordatum TaxID=2364126 RepID=A0ABN9Q6U0_9DINO|nr:unnamed protein product [Polarella glacialis]
MDDTDGVTISLKSGTCPDWSSFFCEWVLTQVLAQLTGIKATVPIAVVAWWTLLGNCPLVLGGHSEYICTWPGCLGLTAIMVTEVVLDLIPGIASVMDVVMVFVKPVFAFILIAQLEHSEHGDATMLYVMRMVGPLTAMVVAVAEATMKVAVDGGSAGTCTCVRSLLETVSSIVGTILSALYFAAAFLIAMGVAGLTVFVCCGVRRLRKNRRTQKAARRADSNGSWGWARATRGAELDSDSDTISDGSDGDTASAVKTAAASAGRRPPAPLASRRRALSTPCGGPRRCPPERRWRT